MTIEEADCPFKTCKRAYYLYVAASDPQGYDIVKAKANERAGSITVTSVSCGSPTVGI